MDKAEAQRVDEARAQEAESDKDDKNEQKEDDEETGTLASGSMSLQKQSRNKMTTRTSRISHAKNITSSKSLMKPKAMKET